MCRSCEQDTSRDGAPTTSLGNLFQCLLALIVKNFFPISKLNGPYFCLKQLALTLSLQALVKSLSPSLQTPFKYWKGAERSPDPRARSNWRRETTTPAFYKINLKPDWFLLLAGKVKKIWELRNIALGVRTWKIWGWRRQSWTLAPAAAWVLLGRSQPTFPAGRAGASGRLGWSILARGPWAAPPREQVMVNEANRHIRSFLWALAPQQGWSWISGPSGLSPVRWHWGASTVRNAGPRAGCSKPLALASLKKWSGQWRLPPARACGLAWAFSILL